MKCGDLELYGLLKGELPAEAQAEARAHLSTCEACGGESERMRIILRSLHTEEWIEPGPAFTEKVLAASEPEPKTETVEEQEPVISSVGQFFRVLFGSARGSVPAWAVSVAVHLVIFGVLALVVISQVKEDESELVMLFDRNREPAGVEAPSPKDIRVEPGAGPGIPERRDPEDPDFDKEPRGAEPEVPNPIPVPRRPREEDDRRQKQVEYQRTWDTAGWYGGEERGERDREFDPSGRFRRVVDKALAHLASKQSTSGLWEVATPEAKTFEVGVTGLTLLAFLTHCSTHKSGPYRETVERAVNGLRANQKGGLIGSTTRNYMYNHAIATTALLECYLRSGKDSDLRVSCHEAVEFLVLAQNARGGWRYQKGESTADLSVTVWVIQALRTAALADFRDLAVGAIIRARHFVESLRLPDGRYLYGAGFEQDRDRLEDPSWWSTRLAMGAFGTLLSTQVIDRAQVEAQAKRLLGAPLIAPEAEKNDLCRLYYGSMMMYQLQGEYFAEWWNGVAPRLADLQRPEGMFPSGFDKWATFGGEHYSTAISALVLQAYHRFPPLH